MSRQGTLASPIIAKAPGGMSRRGRTSSLRTFTVVLTAILTVDRVTRFRRLPEQR